MAAANLLALIDDIATILDDVAILSKVAAKKTAGVLGDDLALNAEQVSGVKADRELPVVWAVAKGSFLNKLILVPAALTISAFLPVLITILMVLGGLYLCFEGFEKIFHKIFEDKQKKQKQHLEKLAALSSPDTDLIEMEKDKIKGAIRTDFILSAEIIVIVLGTVQDAEFGTQVAVVSGLALLITVGVYGLVAGIVKLDDAGLYLLRKSVTGSFPAISRFIGRSLLIIAPLLMKTLSLVGTAAMFLVGGGILVHSIGALHHLVHVVVEWLNQAIGSYAEMIAPIVLEGITGLLAGAFVLAVVSLVKKLKPSSEVKI
jgi:predicted DNA repair protein MutK